MSAHSDKFNQSKFLAAHNLTKPKGKRRWRHGMSGTPLHGLWKSILKRCYTESSTNFKYYGMRGFRVCNEWRQDFIAFKDWALSHGYEPGLEIDRKDNRGDYAPDNCRFLTHIENCKNRPLKVTSEARKVEVRNALQSGMNWRTISKSLKISTATIAQIAHGRTI